MFKSKIFRTWFILGLCFWLLLFNLFDSVDYWIHHVYYPLTMVLGAFVAGFTPEGGGAVAFPVLNVFLNIDRVLARDFSMMIQSVGMTSASIFILTSRETVRKDYRPLFWIIPTCCVGTALGFIFLQKIPVYIIQALFLCLSATFVVSFYFSDHRGIEPGLKVRTRGQWALLLVVLVIGGMVSSLFGTGGDILVYMLFITWFNMVPKIAVRMSIVLQAAISLFGYAYRGSETFLQYNGYSSYFLQKPLTPDEVRAWLCAFPVVLFMAPFGAYVLSRMHVNWMLRAIICMNIFQLVYFNVRNPSTEKVVVSVVFTVILGGMFYFAMRHVARIHKVSNALLLPEPEPA